MKVKQIVIMLAMTVSSVCFAVWDRVSAFAADGAEYLAELVMIADRDYHSDYCMTREDFCVAVSKAFIRERSGVSWVPFEDIALIKPESLPYLAELYRLGLLSGIPRDGVIYMDPDTLITKQDALAFLGRAMSLPTDYSPEFLAASSAAKYASGYVAWFAERGIISVNTDGNFGLSDVLEAGELANIATKTLESLETKADAAEYAGTVISSFAGTGRRGMVDGSGKTARFLLPQSTVFDNANGRLIVFDTYNNAIRGINSGSVNTLSGIVNELDENRFPKGLYADGDVKSALFNRPTSGAVNSKGELIIIDSENSALRVVKNGSVYTLGGGTPGYADGIAEKALFNYPMAAAIDKNDNIYIADTLNNCIRMMSADGKVTTVAGSPGNEGFVNGNTGSALFRAPSGIAVSEDGSVIYVADTGNHRIRKIESGFVTTISGHSNENDEDGDPLGGFADGALFDAMFNLPVGITIADGVLVVADSANNRIRAITGDKVVTLAGNGEPGDADGAAGEAMLNSPMGVSFYNGMLYIADTNNNKIKTITFDAAGLNMGGRDNE